MKSNQSFEQLAGSTPSIIGFVWRPEEITPAVLQMVAETGSRAVFDLSALTVDGVFAYLHKADPAGMVRDIKISSSAFCDPSLVALLQDSEVSEIWVECHAPFIQEDLATFVRTLRELSRDRRCFPITGDLETLAAILKEGPERGAIVLKGCEASGFVSAETAMALYATAKEMRSASSVSIDILIWGGVATPEGAAAFLATGAAGIVFESLHWLTDLVSLPAAGRERLAKLRLDATGLVGLDLQVPCRLFNKGNSRAFKQVKALEDSLWDAANSDASRRSFADQVQARALHPLESSLGPDEVVFLGVEATFAASFLERYGAATGPALTAFLAEIGRLCAWAEAKKESYLDSITARELGTRYPVVQGAMSWITDVPEFALQVSEAGALPTVALGLMDAAALELKLGSLAQLMGERSYAVNVVSLAENPYAKVHLDWILKTRPRFVTVAGGDLSPVKELTDSGIGVIFIAPDAALLRLALEAGVRHLILEGYEAGGHVGEHSTLTLAQMALEMKRRTPELFRNCRLILAGGIFNRESAFMAAMLGADAVQVGTAYLATREVVATGALAPLYQRMILECAPGGTVVSGQDTGLRVRSLRTPRVEAILAAEREYAAGPQDETAFRAKMEAMAAGGLFCAARGLERPGGAPLDEAECLARGDFMSGALAGLLAEARPLESLHRDLVEGPLVLRQHVLAGIGSGLEAPNASPGPVASASAGTGHGVRRADPGQDTGCRIAITGMSMLNSLGNSPEEVWEASLAMKSGVTLVPASRWDNGLFYDPRPRTSEKTYCNVGAFLDYPVSRTELGIPPQDFRTMTTATKYTLWLADRAIKSSGLLESDIPRERIGVIISQNSGEAAGTLTNLIIRSYAHDILDAVKRAVSLTPEQVSAVEREVKAGRMAPDDTTLLGRLNCAAPGFICTRYGFMGPSFAVSAACASSLVALHSALQMIRNGVIDAAIVGGAEDQLTHLHYLEFSALGALYGISGGDRDPREASRPFDNERDGLVLGEGGGMIVIERESQARARGAQVHAVITGMGASNSNLGMVESSSAVQEIAIGASFRDLPYGPDAVGLVECHATSTRQGDVEEVRALKTFYDGSQRTVLTSLKSQIGHTLGASGIGNLIRGTMALKTGILPATLNYQHPDPDMGLTGSGFLIPSEPLDWKGREGAPRRLQVNAFGFGGSNYVVQVEQSLDESASVLVASGLALGATVRSVETPAAPQGVSCFRTSLDGHNFRVGVVAGSDREALAALQGAVPLAEAGAGSAKALRSLAQQGIYLSREDLPVPPLALVFPGQGSQYGGMGRELYESFPVVKMWMDRAAAAADFDLLQLMFYDTENNLQKTRWQQPAMFALEHAMARYLTSLGIQPVALAGHSLGELTALCLAGVFSAEDGFRIVNMRALCMDKAAGLSVEPGIMAAVDAPLELLEETIRDREGVYIGNINSPKQVVICGNTEPVGAVVQILKEKGYRATLLRVSMAFHSPIMKVIHQELEEYIAGIEIQAPRIPVISNTTMAPYPSDPAEIRNILMAHLESPVHWMDNVQTLWNDYAVRTFVEVGPGEPLSNLIADTLSDPTCLRTCFPQAEGQTYRSALAQLFALGHLKVGAAAKFVSLPVSGKVPEAQLRTAAGPAASPVANPVAVEQDGPAGSEQAQRIVQREINRFVMENFGGVLKPNILEAIRQELNPGFQEGDLSCLLNPKACGAPQPVPRKLAAAEESAPAPPGPAPVQPASTPAPVLAPASAQPALASAPAPSGQAASAGAGGASEGDITERLIGIIMETTGFERDEIRPEMDLRKDLSIRSSRLPIIMDAAEREFEITIELEDFIDARSVGDIAQRISTIVARKGGGTPEASAAAPAIQEPATAVVMDSAPTALTPVVPTAAVPTPAVMTPAVPNLAVAGPAGESQDLMEQLIGIIMEATGFERDEIRPEMDLRKDLSIRSSRLPIIMDAAEREFDISIEMEEFIDVRTVQQMAQCLAGIIAREKGESLPVTTVVPAGQSPEQISASPQDEASLKRLVFRDVALEWPAARPIALSPGETVLVLSPDRKDAIAKRAGEIFREDHGAAVVYLQFLPGDSGAEAVGHDLLTEVGSASAAQVISALAAPAGLVISLPEGWSEGLGMAEMGRLLTGFLLPLQAFLHSPGKKFVVLVHAREDGATPGRLLAEGMLGLFLSAALEYASVQFRTLEIERGADLRGALRAALDRGCPVVELMQREGRFFSTQGELAPSVLGAGPGTALNPGDVVVMSGGATGISAELAASLAPFRPRLVFLGRTSLEAGSDPDLSGPDPRGTEITQTLERMGLLGIEASYLSCDVTDPEEVRLALGKVVVRYGRIDGIIHGAGVLRDGLLSQMAPEDFSKVADVKFLGAWNLFTAAAPVGLRFIVGLSSAASIQGNPGQANYAAGNRMMSALLRSLARENGALRCKALMLPPVDGAGMAGDPELREFLERKGVAYIHASELAGLFCRELLASADDDPWVMFMRGLPAVGTALLDDTTLPLPAGELEGGTVSMNFQDFPMIGKVSRLDLRREELEALRSFSLEKDLWIADHRPLTFLAHPLVSAAMILETFMEASRILYPHLQVCGVRRVQFKEMISCPPGVPRPARISCKRSGDGSPEVWCQVALATQDISPAGRLTDRFSEPCVGQVILDCAGGGLDEGLDGFPIRQEDLQTGPLGPGQVLDWYEARSGLVGRYRVLESLDGAGPGAVRGRTTYRQGGDFAGLPGARFQYSPYLFEALLQLVCFQTAATNPAETRSMIPAQIGEMRFARLCREGEHLVLEARLREMDDAGLSWDARGIDDQGHTIIQVLGMRMNWVSE